MTVVQNKNSSRYLRGIMFVGSSSQRTQDFTTVRRETNSLGGVWGSRSSWLYTNYESQSTLHFRTSN